MKSSKKDKLFTEYEEIMKNYLKKHASLYPSITIGIEESLIKKEFSDNPELYGTSNRNERTSQQW